MLVNEQIILKKDGNNLTIKIMIILNGRRIIVQDNDKNNRDERDIIEERIPIPANYMTPNMEFY